MMNELPKVIVVDRDTAADYLLAYQYDRSDLACLLSINDRLDTPPVGFHEFTGHKLALHFDDVISTKSGLVPPTARDARKIVAWAKGCNGTSLVHCAAGVSRSTGRNTWAGSRGSCTRR